MIIIAAIFTSPMIALAITSSITTNTLQTYSTKIITTSTSQSAGSITTTSTQTTTLTNTLTPDAVITPRTTTLVATSSAPTTTISPLVTSTISFQTKPILPSTATVMLRGHLNGQVFDSAGMSLPFATIYIWNDLGLHRSTSTDVNGNFNLEAPAGTFSVEIILPSNRSDLIKPLPAQVSLPAGETKTLIVTVQKISTIKKIIKGKITTNNNLIVTDAQVNLYNQLSGQWMNTTTDSNGEYSFQVGSGLWYVGVRPINASKSFWFWSGPPAKIDLTSTDSETNKTDFTVTVAAAKLTVSLSDESGSPIIGAGVSIEPQELSPNSVRAPQYNKSDASGLATFWLHNGSYVVRAFLPNSIYLNPGEKNIQFGVVNQKIEFIFKSKEAAKTLINGTVKFTDGTPAADTFVSAWSNNGAFSDLRTDGDGNFSLQSLPGDVWHIGAGIQTDHTFYKAPEVIVALKSASTSVQLTLIKVGGAETAPVEISTQTDKPALAVVNTGASIYVPEKSVEAVDDNAITVSVAPTADAPSRADARVIGNAYDVKIKDANGIEIKEFNNDLEINLPYTDEILSNLGTNEDAIKPSYYDESTGAWIKVDNYTIDKVRHEVIIKVRHLTRFALVAPADTNPPAPPTRLAFFVVSPGALTLTWSNPKADFHHVKIYRSEKAKSLGTLVNDMVVINNYNDVKLKKKTYYYTLRSVDAAGNESKNAKTVKVNAGKATKMPISTGLSKGKRATAVRSLQKALVIAGFLAPNFPFNNLFDDQTFLAVKAFQKQNKLSASGKVDAKTAVLLNKIYLLNQTP